MTSEIQIVTNLPFDVTCKFFGCVSNPFDETTHIWPRKYCASKQYVATDMSEVEQGTWFHKGCFEPTFSGLKDLVSLAMLLIQPSLA